MARKVLALRSWLVAAALMAMAAIMPVAAQDDASETPWQDVITGQVEAFRAHDAPAAFAYAGASFQVSYPSAEAFFAAIVTSGYAPIMQSATHSFGTYELMGEDRGVIQLVRFVGKDQDYYDAVYHLTEEEGGWRVQGVQLVKRPGIAI